jgi:hypothetical protein
VFDVTSVSLVIKGADPVWVNVTDALLFPVTIAVLVLVTPD